MSLHVMLELVICRRSAESPYCHLVWNDNKLHGITYGCFLLITINPVPFTSLFSICYRYSYPWHMRKLITKLPSAYLDLYLQSLFPLGKLFKDMSQKYSPKNTLLHRGIILLWLTWYKMMLEELPLYQSNKLPNSNMWNVLSDFVAKFLVCFLYFVMKLRLIISCPHVHTSVSLYSLITSETTHVFPCKLIIMPYESMKPLYFSLQPILWNDSKFPVHL